MSPLSGLIIRCERYSNGSRAPVYSETQRSAWSWVPVWGPAVPDHGNTQLNQRPAHQELMVLWLTETHWIDSYNRVGNVLCLLSPKAMGMYGRAPRPGDARHGSGKTSRSYPSSGEWEDISNWKNILSGCTERVRRTHSRNYKHWMYMAGILAGGKWESRRQRQLHGECSHSLCSHAHKLGLYSKGCKTVVKNFNQVSGMHRSVF